MRRAVVEGAESISESEIMSASFNVISSLPLIRAVICYRTPYDLVLCWGADKATNVLVHYDDIHYSQKLGYKSRLDKRMSYSIAEFIACIVTVLREGTGYKSLLVQRFSS